MEALDIWVSDKVSFFAHLAQMNHTTRYTKCGITLGTFTETDEELRRYGVNKPHCSSCKDGMRVTQG